MARPDNVLRPDGPDAIEGMPAGFGGAAVEFWPVGLRRLGGHQRILPPGLRTGPLHAHCFEEEVFYVLAGTLTARERAPGAEFDVEYALHPGDLVVYPPGTGLAHTFRNGGHVDAVFVALSDEQPGEVATYPESGKVLLRPLRGVGRFAGDPGPPNARPVRPLADADRPAHVVPAGSLPERDLGAAFGRPLSRSGGATAVFVNADRLPPGGQTGPAHWHSADEELVLVLSGSPTLRQLRGQPGAPEASGRPGHGVPDFDAATEERTPLQPGDLVHFGPERALAHQLLNESESDALLLVVGTDDPQDLTAFPESCRVYVKALDRAGAFERAGYWDGEPTPL